MTMRNTLKARARIEMLVVTFGCFVIAGATASAQSSPEFSYSGDEGPGFWGELSPDWENCSTNMRPSPINIERAERDRTLGPLSLDLHATAIDLTNNGHTIEQEYEPGSTLTFEGVVYELSQFHFHTLSEHTIKGRRGVMELHAVLSDAATGNKAVIGQLYEIGSGENPFLAQFDDSLPRNTGDNTSSATTINVADGFENTKAYYTYPGSLTTPGCSPIVTWIVLKKRASLSEEQFRRFNDILGHNFRPLQALNDRTIRSSR
jgi:carbonic anhydrase